MTATVSPLTTEVLGILADAIRAGRLRRGWTVRQLAERVGVSAPTIIKVERGDPTVAAGSMLEAATLVGVPLFHTDADDRRRYATERREQLAMLPSAARPRRTIDDDF